ncbi:MAG: TlpA family protein disulfide reductase [Thiotrichaceae bacterium]|nr:TlpA family protein disulfide reductase [Thiotrichaceae bacterium]
MKSTLLTKIIAPLILVLLAFNGTALAFTDIKTGKTDLISNHLGDKKWTILEIWGSDCSACRKHMPEMVKFDGKLDNARILSVSIDGEKKIKAAKKFIDEYEMKFPTLLSNPSEVDTWMKRSLEEPFIGTPTFVVFNPEGKIVAAQAGIVSTKVIEKFITKKTKVKADK